MYACAEVLCVLTNVSNKFVFRRFPLRWGSSPLSPHCVRPWWSADLCLVQGRTQGVGVKPPLELTFYKNLLPAQSR